MNKTVTELLAPYSQEVRDLALRVRALVLDVIPNAIEQVDSGAKIIGYGFGTKYADLICVIMPLKAGVNLGFHNAVELPDPKGLLEGTGKRHRHVKLKTVADIKAPALRALLKAGVAAKKQRVQKAKG